MNVDSPLTKRNHVGTVRPYFPDGMVYMERELRRSLDTYVDSWLVGWTGWRVGSGIPVDE